MKYDVSLQAIAWFKKLRNDSSLEISPKFQRRPVWLEKERTQLLGTIISKLPFPEVYTQIATNPETGQQQHIVVDGQQRITSILMFIDNLFSLPDSDPYNGKYFRDLSEAEKESFWNYKIVVRNLYETNDSEIRDLFIRLNTNNYSLNDQELRNARYTGAFKNVSEGLADNPIFQDIRLFSAKEVRRMLDVEFVSELLVRAIVGLTNKKDLLETIYDKYNEDFPMSHQYELNFTTSLSLLYALVDEINSIVVRTKSNFYSIFGACYRFHDETKRKYFRNEDLIKSEVTTLLNKCRDGDVTSMTPVEIAYFEAVSRASSDKSRREVRENIIYEIIMRHQKND